MAKQKKTNHTEIPPVPREAIAAVRGGRGFCGFAQVVAGVAHSHEPMNVGRLRDLTKASHSGLTLHNQARFD